MRVARRASVAAAVALIVVACGDATAPTHEITLDFCGPIWAAYRNQGGAWTSLGSEPRVATFSATDRLAIATVSYSGGSSAPILDVRYLSADQAAATFACGTAIADAAATKQLQGSVAGLESGGSAFISMGRLPAGAYASSPTFQVKAPADGPADLVATHQLPLESTQPSARVDKAIVRRGLSYPDGATMPVLDFSSAEAFDLQSNTLTLQGLTGTEGLFVQTRLLTALGAEGYFGGDRRSSGTVGTMTSFPASRLMEGDVHQLNAGNVPGDVAGASSRSILLFYRTPTDRTLALGPAATTPTFVTSGDQIVRVDLAAQSEYGAQVNIALAQPQPSTFQNTVTITATKEYFGGTPVRWSLEIPDLNGVPGFFPLWGMPSGGMGWTLRVSGVPYRFSARSARDGDTYRAASGSGVAIVGQ